MEIDLLLAGKRIHSVRKQHNYSMAAFAQMIGVSSASTINNWEKGRNLPKQDQLEKIALLGNKTVHWILFGQFENYVAQLLLSNKIKNQLTNNQFQELMVSLQQKQITYKQDLAILSTVYELFPTAFKLDYLDTPNLPAELISEDPMHYFVENNINYRSFILPKIETLLTVSKNRKKNYQLLTELLNLVESVDSENKFQLISELTLLFNNLLSLTKVTDADS